MKLLVEKLGSTARPSSPRSQKLCVCVRRSATTVNVFVEMFGKSLMSPLFSATITRPSGRKRTVVGLVSPLKTTVSEKPGCL